MLKLTRVWKRLGDESGAFAVYAAIAFPVFIAIIGFGLDYWSTLSVKARLDAAADTAAIAGAKAANVYVQTYGATQTGTALTNAAIAAGQAAAAQAFKANGGASVPLTTVTPTISVTFANRTFTANVAYSTTRPTGFAGIVGVNSLGLSGMATAAQRELTYVNVYVLVDASQSMGIAANQTAMAQLYAATAPYNPDGGGTTVGCVFGCHVASGTAVTMESVAHANNITLRIDIARAAIYNMAQTAKAEAVSNNIRFAVYQMQQNPNTGTLVNQVYPATGLTSDYNSLMTAMGPTSYILDLGTNNSGGSGDSNQTASLTTFAAAMPAQGDGSSASSPLNYVYVVTDGMLDVPGGCSYGHCMQAVPSTACNAIKTKGATVGVIYTTYVNIYTQNKPALGLDPRFSALVQPYVGLIPGNLSSCSSGNAWFYQATDDTALLNAMNNLFASTLSQVQLTN